MNTSPNQSFEDQLTEHLRALPALDPPAGGWQRLAPALQRQRRRPPRWSVGLALAASVLVSVGVLLDTGTRLQPATDTGDAEVAALMAQSAALERDLDQLRPRTVVWDGHYAATTRALQDQLALVDVQLNHTQRSPAATQTLWRDRVALMSQLVQTHADAANQPIDKKLNQQQEWSL